MERARPLALRIDVDFAAGLERAVPRLLEALGAARMHATFFVVAGANRPQHLWRRLADPVYRRRMWRMGPLRILARLGLGRASARAGFLERPAARRALERIVEQGSELAVHGFDHAWWSDHAWTADAAALGGELDRAYAAMEAATGLRGLAWASPAWRTTDAVLRHLAARDVPYLAECWGREPFLTLDDAGRVLRIPHLPITQPSLETSMLADGLSPAAAIERALARLAGPLPQLCVHDYFEGLLHPALFPDLLAACRARGVETITLRDAAGRLGGQTDTLPCARLIRNRLPGFTGEVSWQGPASS